MRTPKHITEMIQAFYNLPGCGAGGPLHVFLDDGNIDCWLSDEQLAHYTQMILDDPVFKNDPFYEKDLAKILPMAIHIRDVLSEAYSEEDLEAMSDEYWGMKSW